MSAHRFIYGHGSVGVLALVALSLLGAIAIAAAQSGGGGTHVGVAQNTSPATVISQRQEGFKKMGDAFKLIHKELSGPSPDAARIAAAAAQIKVTTGAITGWFPPGSGPQPGVKTHAKAEIWTDAAGFAAARDAFVRQADKSVRQLTDPRERPAWKDTSSALGQACKDCHDSYRVKG
jgi:cytochrome c556